jgi:hypothetical protein
MIATLREPVSVCMRFVCLKTIIQFLFGIPLNLTYLFLPYETVLLTPHDLQGPVWNVSIFAVATFVLKSVGLRIAIPCPLNKILSGFFKALLFNVFAYITYF